MFKNPQAAALIATAERILPLTRMTTTEQRAAAVDIVGDLYALAEQIETRAGLQQTALDLSSAAAVAAKGLKKATKAAGKTKPKAAKVATKKAA